MKAQNTNWITGLGCLALAATLSLAGAAQQAERTTQPGQQTERKTKVMEADKQVERQTTADKPLVRQTTTTSKGDGPVVRVQFDRDWDSRSPNLGEFPPSYRLVITYPSKLPGDNNPRNDDCNLNNNVKTRSGADINTLFRQ